MQRATASLTPAGRTVWFGLLPLIGVPVVSKSNRVELVVTDLLTHSEETECSVDSRGIHENVGNSICTVPSHASLCPRPAEKLRLHIGDSPQRREPSRRRRRLCRCRFPVVGHN